MGRCADFRACNYKDVVRTRRWITSDQQHYTWGSRPATTTRSCGVVSSTASVVHSMSGPPVRTHRRSVEPRWTGTGTPGPPSRGTRTAGSCGRSSLPPTTDIESRTGGRPRRRRCTPWGRRSRRGGRRVGWGPKVSACLVRLGVSSTGLKARDLLTPGRVADERPSSRVLCPALSAHPRRRATLFSSTPRVVSREHRPRASPPAHFVETTGCVTRTPPPSVSS